MIKLTIIIAGIILYAVYTAYFIHKVLSPNHFTKTQKFINCLLLVIIPFFWGILVKSALSPGYPGTSSPQYRKNKTKTKFVNHGGGAA